MFKEIPYDKLGELLLKAREGDSEAFEKLYSETASVQYYLALKHTKDENLASDVVQELYIKLFKYMDKIENPRLFIAYLNRMNYTISMDLVKKYNREITTDFSDAENDLVDPRSLPKRENSDENLVSVALNEIDPSLKDVMVMRYINKMKIEDIAAYLKVSKRTVSRMLAKGIEQLRKECNRMKNSSLSFMFFLTPTSPWLLKSIADSAMPADVYKTVFSKTTETIFGVSGVIATPVAATGVTGLIQTALKKNYINTFTVTGTIGIIAVTVSLIGLAAPGFKVTPLTTVEYTNNFVEYEISETTAIPITEINVYTENGNLLFSKKNNLDKIQLHENGTYTIEAIGFNNQKDKQTIVVTQIDKISPTIDNFVYGDGGVTTLTFSDQDSMINYDKLEVLSSHNQPIPFEVISNEDRQGVIQFVIDGDADVIIEDNANNKIVGHIKFE